MTAMGIIQNLQESLGHVLNNMSRVEFTEAIRTKTVQNMSTAMRPSRKLRLEISLNCLQIAYSLVLGISRQTLQGRCAILCVKQYSKHFSSGFWIALHWIKTAKPLREIKGFSKEAPSGAGMDFLIEHRG
nr:uncharacterized protein LOC131780731 [Pocillopora verrucosa]